MSDPDYSTCFYCGAEMVNHDILDYEPYHPPNCPMRTGLFPVLSRELQDGMVCMDCDKPFAKGDFYVQRETDTPDVSEVVCIGCGMLSAVVGYGP